MPVNPISPWPLVVTLASVLIGCAATETVMMQHPRTQEIVQCTEGYRSLIDGKGYRRKDDCIADLERQGFERSGDSR